MLLAPSFLFYPGFTHSFPSDVIWARQFDRLLADGCLYPRWLPDSFDGLGAPVFYFYPPLAFYLIAGLNLLTFGALTTPSLLSLAAVTFFAASGVTMYAWLRSFAPPNPALVGALIYVATPYHLQDYYVRGDIAECLAYALIPLVALALLETRENPRVGAPALALSYAALILAHLPTALLVSLTLAPAYAAFLALTRPRGSVAFIAACAAGLAGGLLLCALYLAPALSLQSQISADYLWSPRFQPPSWFFWRFHAWPDVSLMLVVVSAAAAQGVFCVGVALAGGRHRATWFWAGFGAICVLLLAGIAPPVWSAPVISKVQFPWRLMSVVDFATATVAASAAAALTPIWLRISVAALVAPGIAVLVTATLYIATLSARDGARAMADIAAHSPDAFEYLPTGDVAVRQPGDVITFRAPLQTLRAMPLATGAARAAQGLRDGALRIVTSTPAPAPVVIRRFYFPAWEVRGRAGPLPTRPYGPARLLSFSAPAGSGDYDVRIGTLPVERWSAVVSLAALIAILAAGVAGLRRRRRSAGPTAVEAAIQ